MPKSKSDLPPNFTEIDGKLYVRINYRDTNGQWRSKSQRVTSQREGFNVIARLKTQYCDTGPSVFEGEKMTFDELMIEYKKANPNKPKWYIDPVEEYFKGRRIRSITYGDLKRFKTSREEVKKEIRIRNEKGKYVKGPDGEYITEKFDRKPATIHREIEQLRSVILFAVGHGWLIRNPFKASPNSEPLISKAEEERRDTIATPEQEELLIAACVAPRAHLRPIVIATLDTGLRRGALLSLTWSCVDFTNVLLRVPPGNRRKKRPKFIAMTTRLRAELLDLFEKSDKQPTTKVFKQIREFKRSWRTACKLAGIEGLRFNDLRHGYSTNMMEAGIPEDMAMKAAGHSNSEVHGIYTNIDPRLARKIAEALDKLYESRNLKPDSAQPTEATEFIN